MPKQKTQNQNPPKKGRPKNSGLRVPHWAHQAVARLSSLSGVSSQKILETALKDGLQVVAEPLAGWINYQKTAQKQWDETFNNLEAGNPEIPKASAPSPYPEADPKSVVFSDREGGDSEGLDLSDLERGHGEAVLTNGESIDGE